MLNILGILTFLSFLYFAIQIIFAIFKLDLQKFIKTSIKTLNILAASIILLSYVSNYFIPDTSFTSSEEKTIVEEPTNIKTPEIIHKDDIEVNLTIKKSAILPEKNSIDQIYEYSLDQLRENIQLLVVDNSSTYVQGYDRDEFGGWIDDDKDCQNTRAEILIDTSEESVVFRNLDNCLVAYGYWYDPYTDQIYTDASNLDIDHFVPLKNAYISGAYLWDEQRKKEYSNYTGYEYHLIPVFKSANREKSAYGPEVWLPENEDFHCGYINIWVEIKIYWNLTVNGKEYQKILEILESC